MKEKEIIKEFERICVGLNGEMITDPNVTKVFILGKLEEQKEEILGKLPKEMKRTYQYPSDADDETEFLPYNQLLTQIKKIIKNN